MYIPHRLPSFSLRTLLVLVGVSGLFFGWLAKEHQIASERLAYRTKLEAEGKILGTAAAKDEPSIATPPEVRWSRRLFGDESIKYIAMWNDPENGRWHSEARRIFPEAKFVTLREERLPRASAQPSRP